MERPGVLKGVWLAFLAMLAVGTATAQSKHMPSRTEDIPDTESGRPAASAERPTFKGRLLIYGPPSLPVTPPPEHLKPAPAGAEATAKTEPASPPTVTQPTPSPVVTPAKPTEAPVAVPIPPPALPPPSVAAPAPAPRPAPAEKIAAPTPPPVVAPKPAPEPPVRAAAPAPRQTPVATPAPAIAASPPPAPVIAAPVAVAAPESRREPIVRPEALEQPAPPASSRPAAPRQDVAIAAPSSSAGVTPDAPVPIDMTVIESIFTCLAPGLPQDWKRAWVEITDQAGKGKVSKFRFTNLRGDDEGEPLVPCNAQELTRRIVGLNEKLPPDRRGWNRALLVIESDGEYEMSYEYPK